MLNRAKSVFRKGSSKKSSKTKLEDFESIVSSSTCSESSSGSNKRSEGIKKKCLKSHIILIIFD